MRILEWKTTIIKFKKLAEWAQHQILTNIRKNNQVRRQIDRNYSSQERKK